VYEPEAEIVRRIFRLCAEGKGVKSIAKALNEDGVPSPRPKQGRPRTWAPSSVRAVLLASVVLHVWAATALAIANRRARPVGYRRRRWEESTYASRTMVWSGPILALFVVYHLLHLTTGNLHPNFVEGDVYHNFVAGFRVVPVSGFYIVAMLCLGLHMHHGVWSMLQTLGLSHPRWNHLRHAFAGSTAAIVVIGNITFPVAVLLGIVR
jgi:succinate dehydrogenase / fumarate reductase cytochrome b subunit